MSYGLAVTNDHGTIQIDQDFSNLALRASGQAVLTEQAVGGTGYNVWAAEIVWHGEFPIIFWQSSHNLVLLRTQINGSEHRFLIAGPRDGANYHVFNWFIYDRPPPSGERFGLQIWDGVGRQVFDSAHRYLEIVHLAEIGQSSQADAGNNHDVGPGNWIVTNGSFQWSLGSIPVPQQGGNGGTQIGGYIYYWRAHGIRNTGMGLNVRDMFIWQSGGPVNYQNVGGGPMYAMIARAPE
ncbi:hypothetical protein [Aureimonas sp. AU40]|uniref:hypothetical protein n=1 Tax=Aureimonas sp. AU40 TaxID=1637747 RepID=UPI000781CF3C|nr:hypothetical protein [Aureimonas sp. AU40]